MFVFNFCLFDYSVSWFGPPWVYPSWDSLCFLDLVDYFLSHVQEVFSYYLFKYFLKSFLSLSGMQILVRLIVLRLCRGLVVCLHLFSFFFLYSVRQQGFPPFSPPFIRSSASVILLLILSSVLFISVL